MNSSDQPSGRGARGGPGSLRLQNASGQLHHGSTGAQGPTWHPPGTPGVTYSHHSGAQRLPAGTAWEGLSFPGVALSPSRRAGALLPRLLHPSLSKQAPNGQHTSRPMATKCCQHQARVAAGTASKHKIQLMDVFSWAESKEAICSHLFLSDQHTYWLQTKKRHLFHHS